MDGLKKIIESFLLRPLRAGLAWGVFYFFKALPLDAASALGGGLARAIGPLTAKQKIARTNLKRAFPEKNEAAIAAILRGMWDNLGRTFAEYPHLDGLRLYDEQGRYPGRVAVKGAENIDLLREDGKPGIFFSAHLANWEINAMSAVQRGLPLTLVYRAPNNPLVDPLIRRARRSITQRFAAKGSGGARESIATLSQGGHLALLADQKMNDGIAVPFFGREAMTAPAIAQLALKFNCPIVPARVTRLTGAHFRMELFAPLEHPKTADKDEAVREIMGAINRLIEGWVRETPEQWLWVHRRWGD